MNTPEDIVVFDKDDTIVYVDLKAVELTDDLAFPHAKDFLAAQRDLQRKLVIATNANGSPDAVSNFLPSEIREFFAAIHTYQTLTGLDIYIGEDGVPGKIIDDFQKDPSLEAALVELNEKINKTIPRSQERVALVEEYHRLDLDRIVHKKTGNPLTPEQIYKNPYMNGGVSSKDIYLLRRYTNPITYDSLRMVMVGNMSDMRAIKSDPHTPIIVVSPDGAWLTRDRTRKALDRLFSDKNAAPHEVFDELLRGGSHLSHLSEDSDYRHRASVTIEESSFIFANGMDGQRVIEEPVSADEFA